MHSIVILAVAGLAAVCHGADILMLAPVPTKSHYYLFDKLAIELVKRGHKVTLMAPYKQPRAVENLTEIVLEDFYEAFIDKITTDSKNREKSLLQKNISPWMNLILYPTLGSLLTKAILESEGMRKFLETDQKFDVLIGENFLTESLFAALVFKYRLPVISISTFLPNYWANYMIGNPAPTSFVPDPILGFTGKMNFLQRLLNTVYYFLGVMNINLFHIPRQDAILKETLGPDTPYILDIIKNTSLVFVNQHFSIAHPRPQLPNMIEIGGYHVRPPGELPKDLKKILDESKHGVILFSLGSHLKSSEIPEKMIRDIIKVFSRLKQTVLWKHEGDNLPTLPHNVIIRKWLPQTDVLAHPNLKLLITPGGALSTTEALYHGVPMVGIPVVADQPINMRHVSQSGAGVFVPIAELDEGRLHAAVSEVLSNPKYGESARRISGIVRDRPMDPMETAMYWIEYVIRHKGAPHLRSAAQDLTWYEFHLLDVYAVVFALIFALIVAVSFFIYLIVRLLARILTGRKAVKRSSSSKKRN